MCVLIVQVILFCQKDYDCFRIASAFHQKKEKYINLS